MFRNQREWLRFNASKDGGEGNGSGGDGDGGGEDNDNAGAVAFQQAMQRHNNNVEAFARQLFDDNYQLRQTNRQLRSQTAPAGSVILNGDEVTRWQAYQALGAPGDLVLASTANTAHTDLERVQQDLTRATAEITTLKRGQLLRDVADAAGMVHSVLATLDKPDLTYEIVVGQDDKGSPTRSVKVKEGDKEFDLDAYAQANWSAFLPALRPTQQSEGTPFIVQVGGGGQQKKATAADYAAAQLRQRYGAPTQKQ